MWCSMETTVSGNAYMPGKGTPSIRLPHGYENSSCERHPLFLVSLSFALQEGLFATFFAHPSYYITKTCIIQDVCFDLFSVGKKTAVSVLRRTSVLYGYSCTSEDFPVKSVCSACSSAGRVGALERKILGEGKKMLLPY